MKGCLSIIVVLAILAWGGFKLYDRWENAEKNPFWKGTESIQVCKKPYYSSDDCYILDVTLLENKSAKINFINKGYVIVYRMNCWLSASMDKPKYTFCRSTDKDGNQWDFMPTWVNY